MFSMNHINESWTVANREDENDMQIRAPIRCRPIYGRFYRGADCRFINIFHGGFDLIKPKHYPHLIAGHSMGFKPFSTHPHSLDVQFSMASNPEHKDNVNIPRLTAMLIQHSLRFINKIKWEFLYIFTYLGLYCLYYCQPSITLNYCWLILFKI